MAGSELPDDLESLAQHGRFVRGLAWRLLRDEDAADDVVQETLLQAVRARPDPRRPLRPWLATVARNVIRKRFRTRDRVRRREEAVARPEGLPATADMVARAEILREVVDAVLALDEPNRGTVLLRYYEDLPPREIARRQGVPVETVRGRLRRAAQQLRRRLDGLHPEGRTGWAPVLAGLCGLEVPTGVLSGTGGAAAGVEAASAGAVEVAATGVTTTATAMAAAMLVGASAAALGGALLTRPSEPLPALPATRAVATERAGAALEPATLRGGAEAALEGVQADGARLTREITGLRSEVKRLEGLLPTPVTFRFGVPESLLAFDSAAWSRIAEHLHALRPLILRAIHARLDGRALPSDLEEDIRAHNFPISAFAIQLGADLGDVHPAAAFTHPASVANLVRALLALVGDPLRGEQEIQIATLGRAWLDDMASLQRRLPSDVLAFERVVEEAAAKRRFMAALKGVLTASQQAHLFDLETEDRVHLDHFSPAMIYNVRKGAHARDRSDLERKLLEGLFALGGFEVEDLEPYGWIAREWVDAMPDALTPRPALAKDLLYTHLDDAQRWARAQAEALRRVLGVGLPDPSQAEALRQITTLLVPHVTERNEESEED